MPSRSLGAVVIKKGPARLRRDAVCGVACLRFPLQAKAGGGGGSRTPVQNSVLSVSTRVFCHFISLAGMPTDRLNRKPATTIRQDTGARLRGPRQDLLIVASPLSRHRRFHVAPLIRQRERSYRSHLGFFLFFYEANRSPRRATEIPICPVETSRPL